MAEDYHQTIAQQHQTIAPIVQNHSLTYDLVEDPCVHTDKIKNIFDRSSFVILGFLKEQFIPSVQRVLQISVKYQPKTIVAMANGWPISSD